MGAREKKVEKYLKDEVHRNGGISRKWVCPGRSGVTDQIVIKPVTAAELILKLKAMHQDTIVADVHFIEVKTVDGHISEMQASEHNKLIDKGAQVGVVFGEEGVDNFVDKLWMSQ